LGTEIVGQRGSRFPLRHAEVERYPRFTGRDEARAAERTTKSRDFEPGMNQKIGAAGGIVMMSQTGVVFTMGFLSVGGACHQR